MNKYKILLIDDNPDMLVIGKRIFERAGHSFVEARNGEEGLTIAATEAPDVVILDYMLPDMYGTDFIQQFAARNISRDGKNIPIVILTARPDYIKDLDKCYCLGLKAFLNKPFGHRELVNVVENIVRFEKINGGQQSAKAEGPAEQESNGRISVSKDWYDDLQLTADVLRGLCRELKANEQANLTEEQLMDLDAIYNSSLRLEKLIQRETE